MTTSIHTLNVSTHLASGYVISAVARAMAELAPCRQLPTQAV